MLSEYYSRCPSTGSELVASVVTITTFIITVDEPLSGDAIFRPLAFYNRLGTGLDKHYLDLLGPGAQYSQGILPPASFRSFAITLKLSYSML
jgi:hypothetical protein